MTSRQREVLEELDGAVSRETATWVSGSEYRVAFGLAAKGVLNLAQDQDGHIIFWLRQPGEKKTGVRIPAGFVVALNRNIQEPGGNDVNFFLFRTKNWDLTQASFQKMLGRALKTLGLRQRDVLQSIPVDQVDYDEAMFKNKSHIVLEY